MLLHGGLYASPSQLLDDTWAYNGTWTQLSPTTNMPGRWGHQLVRDTVRNRLVTFGGRSPTITTLGRDTYTWSNNSWVAVPTVDAPSARYLYGMCYDKRRDRVVLFGGRTSTTEQNDTWEFDGTNWQQASPAVSPPAREEMVMAFDAGRGTAVVFGGLDHATDTLLGDTWEYDGTNWLLAAPTNSPSPRYRCASAYDSTRQRLVVYGGYDGEDIPTETLEYSGSNWATIAVGAGSLDATEMYAGFDPVRNRFVTFGGVGTVFSADTWDYQGANTAVFGTFGTGCPTISGLPSLEATTLPVLGQQFDLALGNLPITAGFVMLAQGFSNTSWNSNPLPYDLSGLGVTGCALEVSPDALFGVVAGSGNAMFGFAVPNSPSLVNLAYYVQAFVPDSAAPNGIGGMSRGGRAVFGS